MLALGAVLACSTLNAPFAQDLPIRIAFPSGMNGQVVVTMERAGIAAKHGLDARFASFQYGPPMMEGLAAGSLDAVVTSLMPVTTYVAKMPNDVRIVASLGHSSHSLLVEKNSRVRAAPDLAGLKVGVSFASDSHLDLLVWLKEVDLTNRVELVNVAPAELATALSNGSVGAIVVRQPQVLRLQQQTGAQIIHTWPFRFMSIVKTKLIASQPEALRRYLDSLRESLFYIAQNHEQTAKWFGEYLRVDPAIIQQVSQEDPQYGAGKLSDIDISMNTSARAVFAQWAADAYAYKMIRTKIDTSKLFYEPP